MPGAPCWLSASRVLYLSTGLDGALVPVSGVVVAPRGPVPPGGRPVVAWAHPTTGVATGCAPSLLGRHFFEGTLGVPGGSIPGLSELLAAGFAVAATDYPGLGTPGPHPYLVGESEGRAVLDSVRAARGLAEVGASTRFAVWGNSQGGQAALFAGQLAAAYAPELSLVGVAAAAPPTDLAALLEVGLGTDVGKVLAAYSFWAWSRVYDAPLSAVVSPAQLPVVEAVASTCVAYPWQALEVLSAAKPLREGFPSANPGTVQPWQTLLARNRPGQSAAGAPVFIAQGTADRLVDPQVTAAFVASLCRHGEAVRYLQMAEVGHLEAGDRAAASAVGWLQDRFAGRPAPNDCAPKGP
jgi:alpha-beta hydrolase superfamily lysophospholipase